MRRNEALKVIKQKLDSGMSRKEIVSEFEEKLMAKSMPVLHKYMAAVPDPQIRTKYHKQNMILFCLLIYFSMARVLVCLFFNEFSAFNLVPSLIYSAVFFYLAMNVWVFRGDLYSIIAIFSLFIIIGSIYTLTTDQLFLSEKAALKVSLYLFFEFIPAIAAVVLSFFIAKKVFPHFDYIGRLKNSNS